MLSNEISLGDLLQARARIAPYISRTPLLESNATSQAAGTNVYLKLENTQQTNSFKIRGAANKLLSLSEGERKNGVATASSGNHGMAVAYIARRLGIHAVIGLGVRVPANKVKSIRQYGAEILIAGNTWEETCAAVEVVQKERRLVYIDPFDDPAIIAGQGTLVLEILEQNPLIDTFIVPLAGGGLAAGTGLAAKSINPNIRVIGVSQEGAPVMYHSIRAGKVLEMEEIPSIADALPGGIGSPNRYTFDLCRNLLDDTVLVSENEIAEAMAYLFDEHHLAVEGAGAVSVAALLHQRASFGRHSVAVISGGSVDSSLLIEITQKYLQNKGNKR